MNLQYHSVTKELQMVLNRLMKIKELDSFRLVGGTALALLYGHRNSVDIDLFAGGGFDTNQLVKIIRENFGDEFHLDVSLQNGISGSIANVKIDLYDWKVPFIHEAIEVDNIRITSPKDIFAYKCDAIINRRTEKDFCDIGEILKYYSLEELITTFRQRYSFISTGAVFPILLKEEVIVRDMSILFYQNNSFEKYASLIKEKLVAYEQSLLDKKESKDNERIQKLKDLIDQKRNKQK